MQGVGDDSLLLEGPRPPDGLVLRGVGELPPLLLLLHRIVILCHLSRKF